MNTLELSAGRGGGLSQGLPANGPYIPLFRAGSSSESRASVSSHLMTDAAAAVPSLHVLAAQPPEALSPFRRRLPPPKPHLHLHRLLPRPLFPHQKKRSRKPSLLIASTSSA